MLPHWFPKAEAKELGRFRNFHKISEGGFGVLYAAELQRPGNAKFEKVVVKKFKPNFTAADRQRREKFLHEARLLKALFHPGIPRYLDGFVSDDDCFFIMEFIEGIDLNKALYHARISKIEPSLPLAFHAVHGILEALDYLHQPPPESARSSPVIHGDIKPKNVMIESNLRVRLIDFTAAQNIEGSARFIGGSPPYAPLEYFTNGSPSPQSDLYSLSVVFFILLTFRPIFGGTKSGFEIFGETAEGHVLERVRKQALPRCLEKLLLQGLAIQASDRFSSAQTYLQALQECARGLGIDYRSPEIIRRDLEKYSIIH